MAENLWKPVENSGPRPELKHFQLSNDEKCACYRILKRLLANPCSLEEGEWTEESIPHSERKCRLVYGKKTCEISVLDEKGNVEQSGKVATLDIYLTWREREEPEVASLRNVQRVQNELTFLGIHDRKVKTCFSLAKRELVREPSYSKRNNCKLQIICDEVILAFCSGPGENEVTVLYNDQKNTAMCQIALWENGQCGVEIRSA